VEVERLSMAQDVATRKPGVARSRSPLAHPSRHSVPASCPRAFACRRFRSGQSCATDSRGGAFLARSPAVC
jgi:hypothetical protein